MVSFQDVMIRFGRRKDFAAQLGVSQNQAGVWFHRNSIPAYRWPDLVAAARRCGVALTLEDLAALAGARKARANADASEEGRR